MKKDKWIVSLTGDQRRRLQRIVRTGTASAYAIRHANVLLAVDESSGGAKLADADAAKALSVSVGAVHAVRRRFVEEGLDAAVGRKRQSRPSIVRMFDGEKEAKLVAIACGKAPDGHRAWTLQMLADQVVELNVLDRCSASTVRRTLQKTN